MHMQGPQMGREWLVEGLRWADRGVERDGKRGEGCRTMRKKVSSCPRSKLLALLSRRRAPVSPLLPKTVACGPAESGIKGSQLR